MTNSQQERMKTLRVLLTNMRKTQETYESLASQTDKAKLAYEHAKTQFQNYQDDLVGDLFNGCYGQEWLLDVLPEAQPVQCLFEQAWVGRCKQMAEGYPYCSQHAEMQCNGCGKQAKRNCETTIGSFICGILTCGKCTHRH